MKAHLGDVALNWQEDGPATGPAVVFAHALSTDLRVWAPIMPLLHPHLRVIRLDLRGHGQSECPSPPYSMGTLVRDAERVLDHLSVRDCVFVGLSVGGLIAQGLAAKRLDLVRAMVLSNTAAKLGTRQIWEDRIADLTINGISSYADASLERWFGPQSRRQIDPAPYRALIHDQNVDGIVGVSHAIAGTDFYTPTAALTLPTLGIAGAHDGSTPPDLVRETTDLIKGSEFALLQGAGHIPFAEKPREYAGLINGFCDRVGHR